MDNTEEKYREMVREYEKCKCCNGTGVQVRRDGIKINCPGCGGTGNRNHSKITW